MARGDITNISLTEITANDKVVIEATDRAEADLLAEAEIETELIDLDEDLKNKADRVKDIIATNLVLRDQMVLDRKTMYGEDPLDIKPNEPELDEIGNPIVYNMTDVLNMRAVSYTGIDTTVSSLTDSDIIETDYNALVADEPALSAKINGILEGADESADTFKELNDSISVLDTGDMYDENTILGFKTTYNKKINLLADDGLQIPGSCLVYKDENTKKYYELYINTGDIELKEVFNPNADLISSFLESSSYTIPTSEIFTDLSTNTIQIIPFSEYGVLLFMGSFLFSQVEQRLYVIDDIRETTTFRLLHTMNEMYGKTTNSATKIEVLYNIGKVFITIPRYSDNVDNRGEVYIYSIDPVDNILKADTVIHSPDALENEYFGTYISISENCSHYGIYSKGGRGRFYLYNKTTDVLTTTILPRTDTDTMNNILITDNYAYTFENGDPITVNKYDVNDNFNYVSSITLEGSSIDYIKFINGKIFLTIKDDIVTQIFDEEFVLQTTIDYTLNRASTISKFSDTKVTISKMTNTPISYIFDLDGYELYSGGSYDIISNGYSKIYKQLLGTDTITTDDADTLADPFPIVGLLANPIYTNR